MKESFGAGTLLLLSLLVQACRSSEHAHYVGDPIVADKLIEPYRFDPGEPAPTDLGEDGDAEIRMTANEDFAFFDGRIEKTSGEQKPYQLEGAIMVLYGSNIAVDRDRGIVRTRIFCPQAIDPDSLSAAIASCGWRLTHLTLFCTAQSMSTTTLVISGTGQGVRLLRPLSLYKQFPMDNGPVALEIALN